MARISSDIGIGAPFATFDWGKPEWFGTAAYWVDQCTRTSAPTSYALGESLAEELGACILGGHGIQAEVGLAAYHAVRAAGLLVGSRTPSASDIFHCLSSPLRVGRRWVHYRFANQRSARLAEAMRALSLMPLPSHPVALRDALLQLPGVGPKTASWIVRNHLGTNAVAIIDIHIVRAGRAAGFFDSTWRLPRDYRIFEDAFLNFASLAAVPAAHLDACMWEQVRELGPHADAVMAAVSRSREVREQSGARRIWEMTPEGDSDQVLSQMVRPGTFQDSAGSDNAAGQVSFHSSNVHGEH